jgi:hypothetical protein
LEAVDGGEPVSAPYDRVRTLVLIDDLEQLAAQAPPGSITKMVASRELKSLRGRGLLGVTAAMRRRTREALATARQVDEQLGTLPPRRRGDNARRAEQARDRRQTLAGAPPAGGANP